MKVNMHEAKSSLSALGKKAWAGERIVIARNGEPWLELMPYKEILKPRIPGVLKGEIIVADDFDAPCAALIADFEGDG